MAPDTHLLEIGSQVLQRWPPRVYLHLHVFTSSNMFPQYITSFGGTVFHTFHLHSFLCSRSGLTLISAMQRCDTIKHKNKGMFLSLSTASAKLIRHLLRSVKAGMPDL